MGTRRVNLKETYRLLKGLQWSATTQGQGSGYMGSGGDGPHHASCPTCKGLRPSRASKAEFTSEVIGHKPRCALRREICTYRDHLANPKAMVRR